MVVRMTSPLDGTLEPVRCWAVERGQQCQKFLHPPLKVHAGPCAFVDDRVWQAFQARHFNLDNLWDVGYAPAHNAMDCPGPPECHAKRSAGLPTPTVMLVLDEFPEDVQELFGEKARSRQIGIELCRGRVVGAADIWADSVNEEALSPHEKVLYNAIQGLRARMIPGGWNGPRQ